jgi:hypothetical protein
MYGGGEVGEETSDEVRDSVHQQQGGSGDTEVTSGTERNHGATVEETQHER